MKNLKQKFAVILTIMLVISSIHPLQVNAASEQETKVETVDGGQEAKVETVDGGQEAKAESADEEQNSIDESEKGNEAFNGSSISAEEEKNEENFSEKEQEEKEQEKSDEGDAPTTNDQTGDEKNVENVENTENADGTGIQKQQEEKAVCEHKNLTYEKNGDGSHKVKCTDCEELLGEEECLDDNNDYICDRCGWDAGDAGEPSVTSLLPLEEKTITPDLRGYTPVELTMVPFSVIFAGESVQGVNTIAYAYGDNSDDYKVTEFSGTANLSKDTYYGYARWQMIPGGEQLNASAERYIVRPNITSSREWLIPKLVVEKDDVRTEVGIADYYYYDYDTEGRHLTVNSESIDSPYSQKIYISLTVSDSYSQIPTIKVFEGKYDSVSEALTGNDITDKIFSADLSQSGSGYEIQYYNDVWITMVSYDSNGTVTGCLPLQLLVRPDGSNSSNIRYFFFKKIGTDEVNVVNYITYSGQTREIELYDGYAADDVYNLCLGYYSNGSESNSSVTAAYAGTQKYDSIAAAQAAGANDIKAQLFSDDGYAADYSQGVWISAFIGEDGTSGQQKFNYLYKTKEGIVTKNSGADVTFQGVKDAGGNSVPCYIIKSKDDSYGNGSYPTILVNNNVDLSNLKPVFTTSAGVRLYAGDTPDTNAVQTSGESAHNFANGPVQYTTASENGANQKNCWLTVIKTDNVADLQGLTYKLYTNSLADANAETRIENGIVYSKREIVFSSDYHDIFLTNMGENVIPKLSVSLSEDSNLEIDEYWTLNGNHDLAAFAGTTETKTYGELPNLAKVRLRAKDGVTSGSEIKGTLTIKSDGNDIMVLELTGNVDMPQILTDTIPEAVKYVPYGVMLQNNNKYSNNEVKYALKSGKLPEGMQLYENGEIYGVPKETGEFGFTVEMACSISTKTVTKDFILVVKDNTDGNVDGATDTGYTVTQRIPNLTLGATDEHTFVSEGVLGEFKKVFLDGVLLDPSEYTAVSGSTRITISSQTLTSSNSTGRHTLGVEFRTSDDTLMRAAQNFYVTDGSKPDSGNSGNDDHNNSNNGTGANSGASNNDSTSSGDGSSTDSSQNTGIVEKVISALTGNGQEQQKEEEPFIYTIKSGDTLWKIAIEYYGNGALWTKLYEDNRDVIADANLIRVGQQIKIYQDQTENSTDSTVRTYVVQKGDTLWKISKKFYGKGWLWRIIYDANKDTIANYQSLRIGQVIIIP